MLVSLIIPARSDLDVLARLLDQLPPRPDAEIIVAFGGPQSSLVEELRRTRPDVVWVDSEAGRGRQLNAGASRARAAWLWFVHADSQLPHEWLDAFCRLDRSPASVVGGSFAFRLDSPAWQARVLERGVAWRVRWLGLPYGDQGIFVRRTVFGEIGGFAPLPLMEDVEFVGRLKRRGELRHLKIGLTTSARRWVEQGWWRRSAANIGYLGLYWLGVSPERLARRYYR